MAETRRFDPPDPPVRGGEPSLGELFRDLARDASALIRQETALARAELREAVSQVAGAAARMGIGAGLALVGVLVLAAALVVFVGDLLGGRYALSAGLVGGALLVLGGLLAYLGIRRIGAAELAPTETLESVRETGAWAAGEAQEFRAALSADGNGTATAVRGATPVRIAAPPGGGAGPVAEHAARAPARAGGGGRRGGSGAAKPAAESRRGGAGGDAEDTRLPLSEPLWKRVWHEFQQDRGTDQAARVAYFFFLSLPPAVMALFGLAGLFGGAGLADWIMTQTAANLPGEASGLMEGFVDDVVHGNAPGPLSIGLLLAIWAGSGVFVALEQVLNTAYDVTGERSWVKGRAVAVGMLVACSILFMAGSAVLVAGPAVPGWLGLGEVGALAWRVAEWPLAFLLIAVTFFLMYYVLPLRDQSGQKGTLFKAAAIAGALWVAATAGFRLYITNFGSYSETYGILGTVIVVLLWLYVTSIVIILGGQIASEMERAD